MNKGKYSVALGTFDGLHLGHMQVIKNAADSEYEPAVLLFKEHPLELISGEAPPELISQKEKRELLSSKGFKIFEYGFSSLMGMEPESFFYDILVGEIGARQLSCGENYSFGAHGKGDTALLEKLCEKNGVELRISPTVSFSGKPVSSTRIRYELENGNTETANAMLGRPYSFTSEVIDGDKRGRVLGFPTANQEIPKGSVMLKLGVYASYVTLEGNRLPSVTNFGLRPTVDGKRLLSETHIIGFSGNLYKKPLRVSFLKFLRDEVKFGTLEQLSDAISKDVKTSSEIFNKHLEISE